MKDQQLRDLLKSVYFPILLLVGELEFLEVVQKYLNAHPLQNHLNRKFGESFPAFLKEENLSGRYPYIIELADFSWQTEQIRHLQSVSGMDIHDLTRFAITEHTAFQFDQSYRTFESQFDVEQICRSLKNLELLEPDQNSAKFYILVNFHGEVKTGSFPLAFKKIFDLLLEGKSLHETMVISQEVDPREAQSLFTFFAQFQMIRELKSNVVKAPESPRFNAATETVL